MKHRSPIPIKVPGPAPLPPPPPRQQRAQGRARWTAAARPTAARMGGGVAAGWRWGWREVPPVDTIPTLHGQRRPGRCPPASCARTPGTAPRARVWPHARAPVVLPCLGTGKADSSCKPLEKKKNNTNAGLLSFAFLAQRGWGADAPSGSRNCFPTGRSGGVLPTAMRATIFLP